MANDKTSFPSDAADKFVVRFPEGMRDRIAEAAKANNRTMNAEIVARLQASFAPAAAQDIFSTPDFQHRLKERALEERLQLTNNQITTLRMHQNLLHMRLQALGKDGEQDDLFDAREQLADAEKNLPPLLAQREALLMESQQLNRAYQDAVRPLNAKAAAMTEELLEPERRAVEDKLRRSNEKFGKLKPTAAELEAAYAAEEARRRQVMLALFGSPDTHDRRASTNAVTTGGDDAPYKVTAPAQTEPEPSKPLSGLVAAKEKLRAQLKADAEAKLARKQRN